MDWASSARLRRPSEITWASCTTRSVVQPDIARLIQTAAGQGDLPGVEQAVDPEHAGGMEALGLHSRGAQ